MWPSRPCPHVRRRQAFPHHVREIRRNVIERRRFDQRFVRRGQHRQARAEARAENADVLIAARLQPVHRAFRVEHRLTAHLQRPADVGADDVVGAVQFRRHAHVVIRHRQPQSAHAEARQQLREADVAFGVGVPLGEQHDGGAPIVAFASARLLVPDFRGEVARLHDVVRRVRRDERAVEAQHVVRVQFVGGRRRRVIERLGVGHGRLHELLEGRRAIRR